MTTTITKRLLLDVSRWPLKDIRDACMTRGLEFDITEQSIILLEVTKEVRG